MTLSPTDRSIIHRGLARTNLDDAIQTLEEHFAARNLSRSPIDRQRARNVVCCDVLRVRAAEKTYRAAGLAYCETVNPGWSERLRAERAERVA